MANRDRPGSLSVGGRRRRRSPGAVSFCDRAPNYRGSRKAPEPATRSWRPAAGEILRREDDDIGRVTIRIVHIGHHPAVIFCGGACLRDEYGLECQPPSTVVVHFGNSGRQIVLHRWTQFCRRFVQQPCNRSGKRDFRVCCSRVGTRSRGRRRSCPTIFRKPCRESSGREQGCPRLRPSCRSRTS